MNGTLFATLSSMTERHRGNSPVCPDCTTEAIVFSTTGTAYVVKAPSKSYEHSLLTDETFTLTADGREYTLPLWIPTMNLGNYYHDWESGKVVHDKPRAKYLIPKDKLAKMLANSDNRMTLLCLKHVFSARTWSIWQRNHIPWQTCRMVIGRDATPIDSKSVTHAPYGIYTIGINDDHHTPNSLLTMSAMVNMRSISDVSTGNRQKRIDKLDAITRGEDVKVYKSHAKMNDGGFGRSDFYTQMLYAHGLQISNDRLNAVEYSMLYYLVTGFKFTEGEES